MTTSSDSGYSRRHFLSRVVPAGAVLASGAAAGLGGLVPELAQAQTSTPAPSKADGPTVLQVVEKDISVNGRTGKSFRIEQPDGTWGYTGRKGDLFHVRLENKTSE